MAGSGDIGAANLVYQLLSSSDAAVAIRDQDSGVDMTSVGKQEHGQFDASIGRLPVTPVPFTNEVAVPSASEDTISFVQLMNVPLKRRKLVAATAAIVTVVITAIVYLLPPSYTSTAVFTPQTSSSANLSAVTGLAAQFGVSVGGGQGLDNPAVYSSLIQTPQFLTPIVRERHQFLDGRTVVTGDFIDLYDITSSNGNATTDAAIIAFLPFMSVSVDPGTGVVSVSITTRWPELSQQIAASIVEQLDSLTSALHRQRAASEQRFINSRLADSKAELKQSETELQRFLQNNRTFATDPQLKFEYDRLNNDLSIRRAVYTTLAQGLEQTRIDALRDTPTILQIQRPILPLTADHKHLKIKIIAALIFGLVLGVGLAFALETWKKLADQDSANVEEFLQLKTAMANDARSIGRKLRFKLPRKRQLPAAD
jgi:uncharacterized protein involved in exopolysaccharide biosynthesis